MPSADHALTAIAQYLAQQWILTLCTVDHQGIPWCASCFYLFSAESMQCYFMSQQHTQHAKMMQGKPMVAGTIFHTTAEITQICGIQYQGTVEQLTDLAEMASRLTDYRQRFPHSVGLDAPLWVLRLETVKMTDNRTHFAQKLRWSRKNGR